MLPLTLSKQSTQHAFSRRLTNPTPPGGTPQPQGELYRDGDTAPPVFGFGDLTVTNPAPADDGARVRLGDALTSATGVILHSAAQAKSATGAAIRDHIITEELEFRTMTAAAAKGVSRIPTPTVNWNKWVEDTSPVDVPDSLSDDATWARLRSYAAAQPPDSLPPTPAASSQPLLLV